MCICFELKVFSSVGIIISDEMTYLVEQIIFYLKITYYILVCCSHFLYIFGHCN